MEAIAAIIALIFYGGMLFLTIGGIWRTFSKAGQPGWACLVPIYNFLVMADVARVSRSKAWQAMGVAFLGMVVYMVLITTIIAQGGSQNFALIGIGMFSVFVTSILSLVIAFPIYKGIALNFGQSVGFAWGLMLLSVIFFAILGFGNYQYNDGNFENDNILDSGI